MRWISLLAALACSAGDDGGAPTGETGGEAPGKDGDTGAADSADDTATSRPCATADIGPPGGSLSYPGIRVVVPPGTVAASTAFEVCEVEGAADADLRSPRFEIAADGKAAWNVPLQVTVDHTGDAQTELFRTYASLGEVLRAWNTTRPTASQLEGGLPAPGEVHAAHDPRAVAPYLDSPSELDLLLVIDNSCSMGDDQAALTKVGPLLLQRLRETKKSWHLGVITTDMVDEAHQGRLRPALGDLWITNQDSSQENRLAQLISQGTLGGVPERGMEAVQAAFDEHGKDHNAKFFRPDASTQVVFFSDDHDYSSKVTPKEFGAWFASTFPGKGSAAHGLASIDGLGKDGVSYSEVAREAKGAFVPIDETDLYEAFFEAVLSGATAEGVDLPGPIDPASLQVWWVPAKEDGQPTLIDAADVIYDREDLLVTVADTVSAPPEELVVLYALLPSP